MNETGTAASAGTTPTGLYDPALDSDSCGVGFITRKDGRQTHDLIVKGHEAMCSVPHRGGMSAEGVGDGGGVSLDLSVRFFRAITGDDSLESGDFGVGNFFLPPTAAGEAARIVEHALRDEGLTILATRDVPVDDTAIRPAAARFQLPIRQWVFRTPFATRRETDRAVHRALLAIEALAYTEPQLAGFYPISLSARTQVLKGRLNSWEVIGYFRDLVDERMEVHSMFFHTRFSTNTDPHPTMAQPFRFIAHNGELNTDKKNRLSETAVAAAKHRAIVRPKGQSDSCRLDQTLQSRVVEDDYELVEAVVAMMPPAWENDRTLSPAVRAMLEYFSLGEEKNDGPAALVYGDGTVIGARLDRLGLRPLRTVETDVYLCAMSEAGQIGFKPETVIRRGRIEAGGMLYFDHSERRSYTTTEALERLAAQRDYATLLAAARLNLDELPAVPPLEHGDPLRYAGSLTREQRYVAYSHNQESFRFFMDPMLSTGGERISAMGYGNAINALSDQEGGVAKYLSQRFAQVTNPPLDSIREADGMTLRVALGAKRGSVEGARQIIVPSPILSHLDLLALRDQSAVPVQRFGMFYRPVREDAAQNERALTEAIDTLAAAVDAFAAATGGIAIVSDRHVDVDKAAIPMTLVVAAVNQRLIESGTRLRVSFVIESGQIASSHHVAVALGFGAAAVYPLGVQLRAEEKFGAEADAAFAKFAKAAAKSLMKTMGRVGLCTAESYIGGEFFEPNYLDTTDATLARYFPNLVSPVGGVGFAAIARAQSDWHERALSIRSEADIPLLGLFKERSEGAGHSFGTIAVRGFVDLTEEPLTLPGGQADDLADSLRLLTLGKLEDAYGITDNAYRNTSFQALTPEAIDAFAITPGYRDFVRTMNEERAKRPAALRDVLALPGDVTFVQTAEDFARELERFDLVGNASIVIRGLDVLELNRRGTDARFRVQFSGPLGDDIARPAALGAALAGRFGDEILGHWTEGGGLVVRAGGSAAVFLSRLRGAADPVPVESVQPAHEITRVLASGAMSHGALVASAHEAVAHGTNLVGGLSNCGEGGEHISRYGTIRGSRIKQFASGRFGVWAGYLADPMLEEIEIKIGQGAKPGEGGQLPAAKVTVDIAAARGGTPGVELVSPPPHHDTYSIEDLAQLIHDAKAARVRVVVKLVSSEGIGTIAVGVAKAGADVINVAGNTGGTGAAAVTSLKHAGRSAEIGIAEVHQALSANGLRHKVTLRCSGAHQTASDVVTSALLGGDSFEFGTTALMMLKCVMAKNCNVKCPAGLTTNAEAFDGDPRALAQYLLNIAHETREILAGLGLRSLQEARGRADLLQLLDHPAGVGQLDVRAMLEVVEPVVIEDPVYLEKDFAVDDSFLGLVNKALFTRQQVAVAVAPTHRLGNANKSVGGQLAIDIERMLNHGDADGPAVLTDDRGRRYLAPDSIRIDTHGSAGQSYGAFTNDGMRLVHSGTTNDGLGKGASGGVLVVVSPGGGSAEPGGNVLVGNFALFGATGGRTFVQGQAGDRFAVRNSGATAVVEGVGDFACEYQTGGAVLNLGDFGKGVGNGMSGGFFYQWDPAGLLPSRVSADSLVLGTFDGSELAAVHEDAVRLLLEWHVEATGSPLAARLLADWGAVRSEFVYGMPRALLLYQDSDEILAAKSRKELVEELATALAAGQIERFVASMKAGDAVLDGVSPADDPEAMFRLLNHFTVLSMAQELALARTPEADGALTHPLVEARAKNLLLTQDFFLQQRLKRYAAEALAGHDNEQLAVLIAHKRVGDYREALRRRNVLGTDLVGTAGWILFQQRKNLGRLGRLPSFDELFAGQALPGLVAAAVPA